MNQTNKVYNNKGQIIAQNEPNGFMFEQARIREGLKTLGIDSGYEIVISDHADPVENTAADTLTRFLRKGGLKARIVPESRSTGNNRLVLGLESSVGILQSLGDAGQINIRDVSPEDDGFHLKRIGSDIVVAGANPRGVLYGVYALEETVRTGAKDGFDLRKVPYYRKRGSGPYYSFNEYVNLMTEDFPEEKAAFLSRMGINQLTDQGIGGHLESFVSSDVFPFQTPPKADFQRKVKAMSSVCKKYGIDQYLFVDAPSYPVIFAKLEEYPPEALGTVKRPWGGGKDGIERTLCVSSPIVQDHLRNIIRKLVREYPDVKGIQFYNMDGESWICTPALCDRCKTVCTDSPQDEFNPWETQANLLTLLAEAAHEERPDFEFKIWGAVHYHGERFDKMIHAVKGFDGLISCWNGSDRSVMIPDIAQPDSAFIISQKLCKERGVPFHSIFEFNNIESVARSLPFPFHVCNSLKKFKRWGVKNITEIYGEIPEHNPINTLVTKEFEADPDQSPEHYLEALSVRQFGETAGAWMYQSWKEMEKAFDAWCDSDFGPLDGSQHILSIGTSVQLTPPILSNVVVQYNGILQILTNVEPWRADEYQRFKEQPFLDKMLLMSRHLAQAAEHAKQAVQTASDSQYLDECGYEGPNGRPTCKEFAELNYGSIAVADAICRQRCNMLRAYRLFVEIEADRAASNEQSAAAKEKQHRELVLEDLTEQRRFCKLLLDFAGMRPCYTRTSLTENEISDLLLTAETKVNMLQSFLADGENRK